MATGAVINVNTGRGNVNVDSGGSSEEASILKNILHELKQMNRQSYVAGRKSESGFGGSATSGGVLGLVKTILGTAGVGVAGVAGASLGLSGDTTNYNRYSAIVDPSGTRQYAQINQKTGKITDILTQEEAERVGVVDELGQIRWDLQASSELEKKIFGSTKKQRDAYLVSNDLIQEHNKILSAQMEVDKDILEAKKKIYFSLKNSAKDPDTKVGTLDIPSAVNTAGAAAIANAALNTSNVGKNIIAYNNQQTTYEKISSNQYTKGYSYLELSGLRLL